MSNTVTLADAKARRQSITKLATITKACASDQDSLAKAIKSGLSRSGRRALRAATDSGLSVADFIRDQAAGALAFAATTEDECGQDVFTGWADASTVDRLEMLGHVSGGPAADVLAECAAIRRQCVAVLNAIPTPAESEAVAA